MSSETVDWLKKVKSTEKTTADKAKIKAAKVSFDLEDEEEFESFSKKPQANTIYTAKDLTGLKVAHDFNSFQVGQSDILVLEDKGVLDEDENGGESLISMNLKEEARLKRLREVARHAKGYSGFKAYEEEDSVILGGPKLSGKVLQKYDFASAEFNDEPGIEGFKLGSTFNDKEVSDSKNKTENATNHPINDFDTVQSSGIDVINNFKKRNNKNDLEKEQKRARKLAKTLFADEPEMIVESEIFIEPEAEVKEIDEDDSDMQRIIAATRREHLKNINTETFAQVDDEPKFVGGKSFDALLMSESIFAKDHIAEVTKIEAENETFINTKIDADIDDVNMNDDESASDFDDLSAFSQEPLVRNGVASTLALLNMRGINLRPRSNTDTSKRGDSEIKLEYFDQFGNKLNSKEAYKELSRKFHGKGPGKGRLEKMKKKREETLKLEAAAASSTESAIVTNLRRQQEETGVPYMLLSSTRHSEVSSSEAPEVKLEKKTKIFGLQLKK